MRSPTGADPIEPTSLSYPRRSASPEFPKQRWSGSPFYIARSWRRRPASLLSAYCHRSDLAGAAYLKHDKAGFKDVLHWQKHLPPSLPLSLSLSLSLSLGPPIKSLVNGAAARRIYILRSIRQRPGHAKNHEARRNSRKSRDARACIRIRKVIPAVYRAGRREGPAVIGILIHITAGRYYV
jgi:hypothetical protein